MNQSWCAFRVAELTTIYIALSDRKYSIAVRFDCYFLSSALHGLYLFHNLALILFAQNT